MILTVGLACGLMPGLLPATAAVTSDSTSAKASQHPSHTKSARSKRSRRGSWRRHGQQVIDTERARQIQEALIRSNYLDGEPTGKWDQRTKDAMQRYQQDNGWQSKVVPDSRALIKLGLGPSNDGLLNPDTAMAPSAAPNSQTFSSSRQR